jgi:CBS domain-containing protein
MYALEEIKIKEVFEPKEIIALELNDTVEAALKTMDRNDIRSVLVQSRDQTPYGFVDDLDLTSFLCNICTKPVSTSSGESLSLRSDTIVGILERTREFKGEILSKVVGMSKRGLYQVLKEDDNLKQAVEIFSKGFHRIAVTGGPQNKVIGLLSQSDVVSWFTEQDPSKLEGRRKGEYKLSDFFCARCHDITSVPPATSALDAFILMNQNNLSSIAVIENKKLVGVISASDVRILHTNDLSFLLNSVQEVIAVIRAATGKPKDYVLCCPVETTCHLAVRMMLQEKVHRIFLCGEDREPISSCSMTDIFDEVTRDDTHRHFVGQNQNEA